MENANIVIIGAGIIGLSIAAEISKNNDYVFVFEKNKMIGMETSSHNSGVIHSGIYYPKGSLKANLSIKGRSMIYEICNKYNIPYKKLGKLIVANEEGELKKLETLMRSFGSTIPVWGMYKAPSAFTAGSILLILIVSSTLI